MSSRKKPQPPESRLERARLLLPLTLANADRKEMNRLCKLVDLMPAVRERGVLDVEERQDDQVVGEILDEYMPTSDGERPHVAGLELIFPPDLERDQRQGRKAYLPWQYLCTGQLRWAVANACHIQGDAITAKRLRQERKDLRKLLDVLIQTDRTPKGLDRVEDLIQARIVRPAANLHVALDVEQDRLRVIEIRETGDLGVRNTHCLLDIFGQYPVSSLARCKFEGCKRYFVPGAEGRRRTRGVMFCTDACKRSWTNQAVRSKPDTR